MTLTPGDGSDPTVVDVPAGTFEYTATGLELSGSYSVTVAAVQTIADGNQAVAASTPLDAAASPTTLTESAPAVIDEGADATLVLTSGTVPAGLAAITGWTVQWAGSTDQPTSLPEATASLPYTVPAGQTTATAIVTAYDSAGNGYELPPVTTDVRPTAPSDLAVTNSAADEIDLAWTTHSAAATDYDVLRSDDGGLTYSVIDTVASTGSATLTYADTTVVAGVTYDYQVDAMANGVRAQPTSMPIQLAVPVMSPDAGVILQVQPNPNTKNAVDLSLIGNYIHVDGFEVEREDITAGTNYQIIAQVNPGPSNNGAYTDQNLNWDDTYRYRARVDLTGGLVSAYAVSKPYTISLAAAPTLDASLVSVPNGDYPQNIRVSWKNAPSGGVSIEARGNAFADSNTWRTVLCGSDDDGVWATDFQGYTYGGGSGVPLDDGTQGFVYDPGVAGHGGDYQYRVRGWDDHGVPTNWSDPMGASLPSSAAPAMGFAADITDVVVSAAIDVPADYGVSCQLYAIADGAASPGLGTIEPLRVGAGGYANTGPNAADVSYLFSTDVTGLTPGTKYDFCLRVQTTGPYGQPGQIPTTQYAFSAGASTTTGAVPLAPPAAIGRVMDAVTYGASPTPRGQNVVHLAWTNDPDDEDGFVVRVTRLYMDGTPYPGGPETTMTFGADITQWNDVGELPGRYKYSVTSKRHGLESPPNTTGIDV